MANINAYKAANKEEQLDLPIQEGDICVRRDINKLYIALSDQNKSMNDWREMLTLDDAVTSVDGQRGEVELGGFYVSTEDVVYREGDVDIHGAKTFHGPILSRYGTGEGEYGGDFLSLGNDNVALRESEGKAELSASGEIKLAPGGTKVTRNMGDLDVHGKITLNGDINGVDVVSLRSQIVGKQDSLNFSPENSSNRGKPGGYAALDSDGRVPAEQLPVLDGTFQLDSIAVFTEDGEDGQLNLRVQKGDICVRTDESKTYVALKDMDQEENDSMDNWQELLALGTGDEIKELYEEQNDTNAFTDAEKAKLSGIEEEAAQSGAEIKVLYEGEDDTNAFTDAEKSKLTGIDANANNYQHPATHPADMIDDTADRRFASDVEKTTWNGKQDALGFTPANDEEVLHLNKPGESQIVQGKVAFGSEITVTGGRSVHILDGNITCHEIAGLETINERNFDDSAESWDGKQDALGFTPENSTNKGQPSGYASLDGFGTVPSEQLPSDSYEPKNDNIQEHVAQATGNPHGVTRDDLDLGASDDVSFNTVNDRDPAVDGDRLDAIEDGANNYQHPATHPVDMIDETAARRFVSDAEKADWNAKQDASEKGRRSGYASLNDSGKVPSDQLPAMVITTTYTANNQTAQLLLTVQEGDVCVRTDESKTYIALSENNASMSNWRELLSPTDGVSSVDGVTGAVDLSGVYEPKDADIQRHVAQATGNPHGVTGDDLGLGASDDVSFNTVNGRDPAEDGGKLDGIELHANNYTHPTGPNPHGVTKDDLGLGPDDVAQFAKINIGDPPSGSYRDLHIRANSGVMQFDRDADSPTIFLSRYDSNFSELWKSFGIEISASESNIGTFRITDRGSTDPPGGVNFTVRLQIGNEGEIYVPAVADQTVDSSTALYIDGVTGQIGKASSVRAAKTGIEPLEDLGWFDALEFVRFYYRQKDEAGNYTDKPRPGREYGGIAEQFEEANPDLVFHDKGKPAGIKYDKLVPVMGRLIQELRAEVAELKEQVAELKGAK